MRLGTWTLLAVASGLAMSAGSRALAQDETTCNRFVNTVTCRTQPDGVAMFARSMALLAQKRKAAQLFRDDMANGRCDEARQIAMQFGNANDVAAAGQCVPPAPAAPQGDDLSARVANAVEFHHCEEAKKIALEAGRLDMADQAMRLCTPN